MSETCNYVIGRGKRKGEMCGKRGHGKGGACTEHRKALEEGPKKRDIAADNVFGSNKPEVAAEPAPKVKSSVWLVTINSQKDLSNMSTEQKIIFKDFAEWIFDKDRFVSYYLNDLTSPNDPAKNIKDLSIAYQFEVGGQQGRLHLHAIVNLKHTGHFKFKANELRSFAKSSLGYNVHLDAPVRSDDVAAMSEYVAKSGTVVNVAK